MEAKRQIKISLKTLIIIIFFIIVAIALLYNLGSIIIYNSKNQVGKINYYKKNMDRTKDNETSDIYGIDNGIIIENYEQYINTFLTLNGNVSGNKAYFNESFFSNKNLLLVQISGGCLANFGSSLSYFDEEGNKAKISISIEGSGCVANTSKAVYLIPVSKNIQTVENTSGFVAEKLENIRNIIIVVAILGLMAFIIKFCIKKVDGKNKLNVKRLVVIILLLLLGIRSIGLIRVIMCDGGTYKPIIYLYPTEETELTVKLKNIENITCSYPTYKDSGWNVLAKPNGDLTDLSTGRNLYSLYYESTNVVDFKVENDGFCVKGEDTSEFLKEELAILGLTEREAEEFIVYWLPKLQENKYNYIRFATIDEINENMPLSFSKEPDTLIRVLMTYKGLNAPIEVEEQQLKTPERNGFVAVEWGGTEIK